MKKLIPLALTLLVLPFGFFDGGKGEAATPDPNLPPASCSPQAAPPDVEILNFAYFMGGTYACGGPPNGTNCYHFVAKVLESGTGLELAKATGTRCGDTNLNYQVSGYCLKPDNTGRFVFSHLWIGVSGYSKSTASAATRCKRSGGGTAPETP